MLSPVVLNNLLVLGSFTEHEWEQLAVLPANVTEYYLSANDGIIYADFRISAFNQYGSSETATFGGMLLFVVLFILVFYSVVSDPVMPEVDAPVIPELDASDTLWFLVIFVLFGLFLVSLGIVILSVIFRKFRHIQSGGYSCKHEHILIS